MTIKRQIADLTGLSSGRDLHRLDKRMPGVASQDRTVAAQTIGRPRVGEDATFLQMVDTPAGQHRSTWTRRLLTRIGRTRSRFDEVDVERTVTIEHQVMRVVTAQFLEAPFQVISKGINTKQLDDFAEGLRSRASRRFGASEGITHFVLSEAVDPDRSDLTDLLLDSAAQALLDPAMTHEDVVLELGREYFSAVCDDPCIALQMFAWLGARESRRLRNAVLAFYKSLDLRVTDSVQPFLQSWERQPVAGVTYSEITTCMTAMIEGLAIRTAVDPDAVSEELAPIAVLTLLKGMTEPVSPSPM